jgi:hypothetical protein
MGYRQQTVHSTNWRVAAAAAALWQMVAARARRVAEPARDGGGIWRAAASGLQWWQW